MESRGGNGERRKPPQENEGDEREMPGGIEIPKPIQVRQDEWENHGFDQFTALKIKDSGERGNSTAGKMKRSFTIFSLTPTTFTSNDF